MRGRGRAGFEEIERAGARRLESHCGIALRESKRIAPAFKADVGEAA
jgi:hypothetical protein